MRLRARAGLRIRSRAGLTAAASRNSATRSCQPGSCSDRSAYGRPLASSPVQFRIAALDIEACQEKQPDAAIPLDRERLHVVLEADEDMLPEVIGVVGPVQFDIDLEYTLQRLRLLGLARIGCDLSAPY